MAEIPAAADASTAPAEEAKAPVQILDEVTGDMVSKNELKKR